MAYSLTVAGYSFDNPPESYRKHLTLGNTPVPHFDKPLAAFYQSGHQEIQVEVEGRLSLNEQSDLDELSELQEVAIEGGEVDVDFDPFFSGTCIIEDDPFRQADERGRYRFIMTVNSLSTDSSAYPAHATPTTGNTFELGSFDFGYDPESVQQNYERQTDTVDRLQGISQSTDSAGLVTKVTLDGDTDGAGAAALWDKARNNELSYLEAEFQNGWALIADLSISNNERAPDYVTGLFQYSLDLLIVSNPEGGIGEVSSYIDHDVQESGTYVSDSDSGSYDKDAGSLSFTVSNGTGSLNGDYVAWDTTTLTLSDNATNSVYISDDDGDGNGTVASGTSGYPANTIHLYTVETSGGEITEIDDDRAILVKNNDADPGELLKTEGLYAKLNKGSGDTTAGTQVAWVTTEVLLAANATNYVFVDSTGDIDDNTSGYPSDTVHLYRLDTDADSVTTIRDDRPSDLSGASDSTDSDLVFKEDMVMDDSAFAFARVLALSDSFDVDDSRTLPWLGFATLAKESFDVDDSALLPALGVTSLSETVAVGDGGSATGTATTSETSTWQSSSDWDGAVSETGVVHENVTNTDHTDDTVVKQGYAIASPYKSANLVRYYPLHEDSGTTAYDFSGNNADGTLSGATVGATGLLGTTAYSFDGTDDYVDLPTLPDLSTGFTVVMWFKPDDTNNAYPTAHEQSDSDMFFRFEWNGTIDFGWTSGGSFSEVNGATNPATGSWHHVALRWDGTTREILLNASSDGSDTPGSPDFSTGHEFSLAVRYRGGSRDSYFAGDLADVRVYDTALSDSEIQALYDVVKSQGTLTTATKSFSESVKPDLQNLSYTLNGQTITLDVIGSPGESTEEINTVSLTGQTSETLSWADPHTDFRLKPKLNTTDVTSTPTFNQGELEATIGTQEPDQNPNTEWLIFGGKYDTSGNEYEGGGVITRYAQ